MTTVEAGILFSGNGLAQRFAELLREVGLKNARAHDELCRLSRTQLVWYGRRLLPSEAALDDVMQETLIAIWLGAGSYAPAKAAPMTWMMSILRNKAVDYCRTHARSSRWEHACPEGTTAWHWRPLEPDGACEQLQQLRALRHSLDSLHHSQRAAVELQYFHELSATEVAAALRVPLGTAKTWIRRGCGHLRTHFLPCTTGAAPVTRSAARGSRRALVPRAPTEAAA